MNNSYISDPQIQEIGDAFQDYQLNVGHMVARKAVENFVLRWTEDETLPAPVGKLLSDEFEGHRFEPEGSSWPFNEPLYTETQVKEILAAALAKQSETGWDNFNALQHINNWLISKNLLVAAEDGDALAAARNVTRSLDALLAQQQATQASLKACVKAIAPFVAASRDFDRGPGGHPATDKLAPQLPLTVGHLWALKDAVSTSALNRAVTGPSSEASA